MTGANGAGGGAPPLRILVVHRYYWPDTPPCASLLRRIAAHLRQEGHQVHVLSSQPSYRATASNERRPKRDVIDDVTVERLNLPTEIGRPVVRILNALRLGTSLLYRVLTRRYDVIVISTVPPILGGFSAALAARLSGARFIYHAMDIHPEIGRISGEFSQPLVFKTLRKLDSWSCRQADPVVVLSRDMEKTLRGRAGGDRFRVEVLNNFPLPDDGGAGSPEEMGSDRLTVIYAGNLGRFQGLQTIVEAMEKLTERTDIELLLMGDGVARSELEAQAKRSGAKVRFLGTHPVETAKAAMRRADIGFVSLIPEMYRYAYPSKTMAYLEQGCPIIAAVEDESDLARQIRDQRCGFSVPPGDSDRLAALLASLADDSKWKAEMKKNASRVFESEFSEEKILRRWSDMVVEGTRNA
nr:glycosyltransferase family 4 protein [Thioalkalivibrio sp. ALMg11]